MDEAKEKLRETKAETARVNWWDGGFDGWKKSKGSNKEQKRERKDK